MNYKLLTCVLAAAAIMLSSCESFLDTVPDNRTEIDDASTVKQLLVNAYPKQTSNTILEPRCDGMTFYGSTFDGNKQDESFDFMRGGFYWMPHTPGSLDEDSHQTFWEASYKAISYCNFALQGLEKYGSTMKAEDYKQDKAEARIARAFNHFSMLTVFTNMFKFDEEPEQNSTPGLPYVTEPENEVFKKYDRETVALSLAKVKADLFEELDNIGTDAAYVVPKFHFTRNSALAFAVRYCLYVRDYMGVVRYANMLLPSVTSYTTTDTTSFAGLPRIYVSESDRAYQYATSANNYFFDMKSYKATGVDLYQPGKMFTNPENRNILLVHEPETLAMRAFLGTLISEYAYDQTTLVQLAVDNIVSGGTWQFPMLKFTNDRTGFIVKYYEDFLYFDEAAGIGWVYNKVILFRTEEVLLARAEAKAMMGDLQGAIDDLNLYLPKKVSNYTYANRRLDADKIHRFYGDKVDNSFVANKYNEARMAAAGAALTYDQKILQKELIMTVMDFRRAEFLFEGTRYIDILRWNIPVTHKRATDNVARTLEPNHDNRILQLPAIAKLAGIGLNQMDNVTQWPDVTYDN